MRDNSNVIPLHRNIPLTKHAILALQDVRQRRNYSVSHAYNEQPKAPIFSSADIYVLISLFLVSSQVGMVIAALQGV
jgi:hypothetical protein